MKTKKSFFVTWTIILVVLIAFLIVGNMYGFLKAIAVVVDTILLSFMAFGIYIFFYEEWYLVLFDHMGIYVYVRPEMAAIVKRSGHYQVIEKPFSKGFFVWPSDEVIFVSKTLLHIDVPMQAVYENRGIEAIVMSSDALREHAEAMSNVAEYNSLQEYITSDQSFRRKKERTETLLREYFSTKNSDKVDFDVVKGILVNNLLFPNLTLVDITFKRIV